MSGRSLRGNPPKWCHRLCHLQLYELYWRYKLPEKEGLEVLSAISRFWADRVHYSKRQQKYMIHGVTGPNEYENNINNNWYTNKMALVLAYTLASYEAFKDEATVTISDEEQAKWQDIIDNMYFPEDQDLGVFVQHDTFLDKDLMPVSDLDSNICR